MSLPKYRFDEDNGLIYKLEGDYYYPEIWTESVEKDLSLSTVGRAKIAFMKEHELELYVQLTEQGELFEHLKEFCSVFHECVNTTAQQLGDDANAFASAREIVYAQMFELPD